MVDGVKVFTATMWQQRGQLGETVTAWIAANRDHMNVVDIDVRQSSDAAFHCLTLVVWFKRKAAP